MREDDVRHLQRCLELAQQARDRGDRPFGSILVGGDGTVLQEAMNCEVTERDVTGHPELVLARWASQNLSREERAAATVYTSCEHCPMCAAAHGWVGLGRIVYATSSAQLAEWWREMGVEPPRVRPLPIREVLPDAVVDGPAPELAEEVRELHRLYYERMAGRK